MAIPRCWATHTLKGDLWSLEVAVLQGIREGPTTLSCNREHTGEGKQCM